VTRHLHVTAGLGAAQAVTAAGWERWARPAGWAGLLAAEAAALALVPLAVVAAVYGPPAAAGLLVPYRWRMRWRRGRRRPGIPARLRAAVLAADRYRCVWCGDPGSPQVDHIRPWSCGGRHTLWNLAVLCPAHNRVKSNYWAYRSGLVVYRSRAGSADAALAAAILAAERRARLSPARWYRASWALR
jgi:hypothetical protein